MSVIHCPSNCEHDYMFQHSIITNTRYIKEPDGSITLETRQFIVCNDCRHWVNGGRGCAHWCHEESGEIVASLPMVGVN